MSVSKSLCINLKSSNFSSKRFLTYGHMYILQSGTLYIFTLLILFGRGRHKAEYFSALWQFCSLFTLNFCY